MMKSFIFNCDDFIPNDRGGTFICGRRRFALVISSPELLSQIMRHVKEKVSFTEAEYPPSVILALLREDLLVRDGDRSLWFQLSSSSSAASLQLRCRQFCGRIKLQLESDPIGIWMFFNLRSPILWMLNDQPSILLKKKLTNAMVRPWAWVIHPVTVAIFAVANATWLIVNYKFTEFKTIGIAVYTVPNPFLVIVLLMTFFIIHELAHAAAAYNRLGKCGEIRIHRFFYVFPYFSAHLPDIGTCSRTERLAISASGPVIQILSAILLTLFLPHSVTIRYTSELSIMLALLNLFPIGNADGYWILVELLDGRKPRLVMNWSIARGIDIAYTIGIGLSAGVVILLIFR